LEVLLSLFFVTVPLIVYINDLSGLPDRSMAERLKKGAVMNDKELAEVATKATSLDFGTIQTSTLHELFQ